MTVLTNVPVNQFVADALRLAAEARQWPNTASNATNSIRNSLSALPRPLQPLAVDALRAHAAAASDAQERVDALRALDWVVTR